MSVQYSPWADVALEYRANFTQWLLDNSEGRPADPCFIDGHSGETYTYGQVASLIRRTASALHLYHGLRKGDVLAIYSPNHIQYPVLYHAVAILGGTVCTINPAYTAHEVEYHLKDSGARYLATLPELADAVWATAQQLRLRNVFTFSSTHPCPHREAIPVSSLFELGNDALPHVSIDPMNDVVCLPYSSGTTGLPKGVCLTHFNLISNFLQMADIDPPDDDGHKVHLGLLPFFHSYGMLVMNAALLGPHPLVVIQKFELKEFLGILEKYRVTHASLVPPIVIALAKHPLVNQYNLSLKRVGCGAAALGDGVAKIVEKKFGCVLRQGYGMTELSPVATMSSLRKPIILEASGQLLPNTEAKVVEIGSDDDSDASGGRRRLLGPMEQGELYIRGPQVMAGYHNNPAATRATIDADGWLRTGDIAYYDRDGYFYIVDRLKELIKTKGFQVAPAELEAVLLTHPKVADAAVVPSPDERAGEVPKAFVVAKPNAGPLTEQEVMEFVAGKVAHFKRLHFVEFVAAIPKTSSGKILRRDLKERERQRIIARTTVARL